MCTLTVDELADIQRAVESALNAGFVAGVLVTLMLVGVVWVFIDWRRSPKNRTGV